MDVFLFFIHGLVITGVAFFAETAALGQLWLFWVAPIIGAVIGAVIYKLVGRENN